MTFIQIDPISWIPDTVKQQIVDGVVTFVADQAKKTLGDEVSGTIKRLRSDAAFQKDVDQGLKDATDRFVRDYMVEDEDLVTAIAQDSDFWQAESVRAALLEIIQHPGTYLAGERAALNRTFVDVLRQRVNRERVDRAVTFYLRCVAEALWHLEPLRPLYEMQLQRMSVERATEMVQELRGLRNDVQQAMVALIGAVGERQATLEASNLTALPETRGVRHNLPQPDYGTFIGRQEELAQVHRILRPYPHSRHPLVTIDGIGGIGKSALALESAHRYLRDHDRLPEEERFDAIVWTSAKSSVLTADGIAPRYQITRTLDDIYITIAQVLGREDITRARPEEQDGLVTKVLTQQRTLLIFDNFEAVDDEQVYIFIRELPMPTKAIITTRCRTDMGLSIHLASMPQEKALAFIAQECKKKGVALSDEDARKLYRLTDGVPLAMVWSVAQMGYGYSAEIVLQRLGEATGDITHFCFEGAMKQVRGKDAHRLLVALSLFAANANREALGYVTALSEVDRDNGLGQLEKLALVHKTREGSRFHTLPIVKRYTMTTLSSNRDPSASGIRSRMIDYFLKFALTCCGSDYSGNLYERYPDLDTEFPNILSVLEWCYINEEWESLLSIVHALTGGYYGSYLISRGLWNVQLRWIDRAVEAYYALPEESRAENRWKVVMLLNSGCWTNILRGERAIAIKQAELAVSLARKSNDLKGLASALRQSGYVQQKVGNLDEARGRYQEALDVFDTIGDKQSVGGLMAIMGELLLEQSDFKSAENWLRRSVHLLRSEESQTGLAHALQRYGLLLLEVGRLQEARSRLEEGIELAIAIQNLRNESECKLILAKVLLREGEVEKAKRVLSEAYEGLKHMGMESAKEAEALYKALLDQD